MGCSSTLRHSIDTYRDGHGQHAEQKASEDLQHRMAGRAAVAEIPDREEQYRRDKDTDHVRAILWRSVETRRKVHGRHAEQKTWKNVQGRTAGRRAVKEIPDDEQQYPRDNDSDHVIAKP